MPSLVFRLRNVPEDEADDVRSLLDANHIDWYETTAGNWGIAMPGLWVSNDEDTNRARQVIEQYQKERGDSMRAIYKDSVIKGEAPSLIKQLKEHPLRTLGIVLFCLFIIYVTVNPFLQLIGYTKL